MAKIIVHSKTYGEKTILFDESDSGVINPHSWYVYKHRNTFYAATNILLADGRRTKITMHRHLLGFPDNQCDHIDHNGLNNQRGNIRDSTHSQNQSNKSSMIGSTSKYVGVCLPTGRKKWVAQIKKHGIKICLGNFDNEIDAALAYNTAAIKIHGEFANLNIIC